jgi:hypothetical protein
MFLVVLPAFGARCCKTHALAQVGYPNDSGSDVVCISTGLGVARVNCHTAKPNYHTTSGSNDADVRKGKNSGLFKLFGGSWNWAGEARMPKHAICCDQFDSHLLHSSHSSNALLVVITKDRLNRVHLNPLARHCEPAEIFEAWYWCMQ